MSRVTGKVPRAKINFGDFGVNRDLVEYRIEVHYTTRFSSIRNFVRRHGQ